jgi:hypothetical protein
MWKLCDERTHHVPAFVAEVLEMLDSSRGVARMTVTWSNSYMELPMYKSVPWHAIPVWPISGAADV